MSLDTLKKSNSLDKILAAVESENAPVEKQSYVDERLWKPELDKSGNGYAVIRFLPAPDGEDMPWAKLWNHAFQGPTGKWYIENSLTTLTQKDPVSEYNSQLWNSGVESDKEIARKQKRKLQYYSNIYVVSDPKHPENEGKVNNVYKDTDCYITSDCKYVSPMNWIEQHENNFKKYPDKKFYRVMDDSSEIPEWSDYNNVKTITYGNMWGRLVV